MEDKEIRVNCGLNVDVNNVLDEVREEIKKNVVQESNEQILKLTEDFQNQLVKTRNEQVEHMVNNLTITITDNPMNNSFELKVIIPRTNFKHY